MTTEEHLAEAAEIEAAFGSPVTDDTVQVCLDIARTLGVPARNVAEMIVRIMARKANIGAAAKEDLFPTVEELREALDNPEDY